MIRVSECCKLFASPVNQHREVCIIISLKYLCSSLGVLPESQGVKCRGGSTVLRTVKAWGRKLLPSVAVLKQMVKSKSVK